MWYQPSFDVETGMYKGIVVWCSCGWHGAVQGTNAKARYDADRLLRRHVEECQRHRQPPGPVSDGCFLYGVTS